MRGPFSPFPLELRGRGEGKQKGVGNNRPPFFIVEYLVAFMVKLWCGALLGKARRHSNCRFPNT